MSSGTPGYIKSAPIKTAKVEIAEGDDYMKELKGGIYLRGAANDG